MTPELLREIEGLGKELQERLQWTARIGRELLNRGWDGYGMLYDIDFYKSVPIEESRQELRGMGLKPEGFDLEEEELEEYQD